MSKRIRFILTAVLLSGGFFAITFLGNQDRFWGIIALSIVSVALFYWTLYEGLGLNATILVLFLPAMYTLGVGMFWFLLPSTLFATLPIIVLYGVGVYALCLTSNIYTVSIVRTIALSRAAKGVGFVLTLFTSFLLYDALLSLRISFLITTPVVFVISFVLFVQGLWSSQLEKYIGKRILELSLVSAIALGSINSILFFWPLSLIEISLFLTLATYVLLGLGQAKIEGRLFKSTIREYIIVGVLSLIFLVFSTSWRNF